MAFEALNWAWEQKTDSTEKHVLVALAHFANRKSADDEYSCWPKVATLVEMTGLSEKTVRARIRTLEEGGWIERVPRFSPVDGSQLATTYLLKLGEGTPPPQTGTPPPPEMGEQEEPVVELKDEPSAAPPRNVIWDALAEYFGSPATPGERSDFGKTVRDIKQVLLTEFGAAQEHGPSPTDEHNSGFALFAEGEIRRRVEAVDPEYRSHRSLRNRWAELGMKAAEQEPGPDDDRVPDPEMDPCVYCEGTGLIDGEVCKDCGGTGEGTY